MPCTPSSSWGKLVLVIALLPYSPLMENLARCYCPYSMIHIRLKDDNIWVEEDGTEDGVATDSIRRGLS